MRHTFPASASISLQKKTHRPARVVYISVDHCPSRPIFSPQLNRSFLCSMTDGCKMSLVPTFDTTTPVPSLLTCIASVNEARAMRIAEILSDFRHLQHYIANIRANPSAEDYYEEGYCVLRQCAEEAHAQLAEPFICQGSEPDGDCEEEKAQLQRYVLESLWISQSPQSDVRTESCSTQAFGALRSNRPTSKQARHYDGSTREVPYLEQIDLSPFIHRRCYRLPTPCEQ
jgi:hypothetical protein